MSERVRLPRPTSFDEALDNYLWLTGQRLLVSEGFNEKLAALNPSGAYSWGPEDRKAANDIMLAFAVKERKDNVDR